MKIIGVVVGKNKDTEYKHTKLIIKKLLEKGFKVMVKPGVSSCIELPVIESSTLFKDSEFIICVGGDGTFLNTARKAFTYKKPVLGINKGTVGFLAEVEISEIEMAIDSLVTGEYGIQSRMVLDVTVMRNGEKVYENIAINDAVITRMALSRILRLIVMIDDKYADSFSGDGVIISTPTGSTGYSLSAGGPIVQPDMRLVIVSPICPHILHSRSYIASDTKTVSVIIDDKSEIDAILTLDGQEGFTLELGDQIIVKASDESVYFASVKNMDFYDILRAKMHRTK
ncbi:MAG: NAD(+)/NADH kinase [Clostridiaceae bacterium]|nr:NAD(+)/NADH kinase [Clostridiaceae bacterium]